MRYKIRVCRIWVVDLWSPLDGSARGKIPAAGFFDEFWKLK